MDNPYRLPGALFSIGQLNFHPSALQEIGLEEIANAITRHGRGDWGEVDADDWKANEDALREGTRLVSVYHSPDGSKFNVITEADRNLTTVMLIEDY